MAILIVDDENNTREALRTLLERLGWSPILEARNGQEALKIASAAPARIDMIIADWEMPYMDGLQLLKEVARKPELDLVPFLLITSDLSDAILTGFHEENPRLDHHLLKPFRLKGLSDAMDEAALRRGRWRNTVLLMDRADSSHAAAIRRALEGGKAGHWRELVAVSSQAQLEKELDARAARVGCVLLAPGAVPSLDAGWLTSFKKTPLGSSTTFVSLSRDPVTVRPIRTHCQLFFALSESDAAGMAGTLRRLSRRVEHAWPVEKLLREMKALARNNELKAARQHFTELFKLDELSSESHVAAAEICEALGDVESACRQYRYAIDSNPCVPRCHIKLLSLDREPARQAETAVQFCPENVDVLVAAARAWKGASEPGRAREAAERALALAPGHKGALEVLAELAR